MQNVDTSSHEWDMVVFNTTPSMLIATPWNEETAPGVPLARSSIRIRSSRIGIRVFVEHSNSTEAMLNVN